MSFECSPCLGSTIKGMPINESSFKVVSIRDDSYSKIHDLFLGIWPVSGDRQLYKLLNWLENVGDGIL